jgi:hypothetical protein
MLPRWEKPLCLKTATHKSHFLQKNIFSSESFTYYKIYEFVIDVGNQTTCNISDLEDAETYYFVVTAYNISAFESYFSSELRHPEPFSATISLVEGTNLISLPLEPLNPTPAVLTEQLSPCLLQVLACENDTLLYYHPSQLDQNTLTAMEPGTGY